MGRAPCCEKVGLKRGPWTPEEDLKLINYISENGHGSWRALPKKAGLLRCGKSCRLRWTNYLRPDIKRGEFSGSEEQTIIQLHALLGNRWSAIASHLPKRTDNEIKNYWNTHLKKRLSKMGIDPATHKPRTEILSCGNGSSAADGGAANGNAALSHMAQWESARLEAEARLARESKMRAEGVWPKPTPPSSSCSTPSSFGAVLPQHHLQTSNVAVQEGKPPINSLELMTSLRNWEKSLQGQAGLMWPDSWRSIINPSALSADSVHENSTTTCCSSPRPRQTATSSTTTTTTTSTTTASPKLDHGSPTSTLCSWDVHLQNSNEQANSSYTHQTRHSEARKLSWSDSFASRPSPLEYLRPFQVRSRGEARNIVDNFGSSREDEGASMLHSDADGASLLRGDGDNGDDEFDGRMGPLGLPCLQDLVFDTHTVSDSASLLLSDHHDGCHASSLKRDDMQLELSPHDDAELSGQKTRSSVNDEHDDTMADLPMVVSGGSSSSSSTPRPVSFSALLTEDFPDYWSSMLKDDVDDSSIEQVVNSAF